MKLYYLVCLFVLTTTELWMSASAQRSKLDTPTRAKKKNSCTSDGVFKHGRRFEYKYRGHVQSGFVGTSSDRSQLEIKCTVYIEVPRKCQMTMKVKVCLLRKQGTNSLTNSKQSTQFSKMMKKYPVEFEMRNGRILTNSTTVNVNEPLQALNVKRAIISSLQLTILSKQLKAGYMLRETDVNGECDRKYTSGPQPNTVQTETDLTSCTRQHKMSALMPQLSLFSWFKKDIYNANLTGIQEMLSNKTIFGDLFNLGNNLQVATFPIESHVSCKYVLNKNKIKGVACDEQHVFPYLKGHASFASGAMANIRFVKKVKGLGKAAVQDALRLTMTGFNSCLGVQQTGCSNTTKALIMHYWRDALFISGGGNVLSTLGIVQDMGFINQPVTLLPLYDVALNHDVTKETINDTLILCTAQIEGGIGPWCLMPLSIMIKSYLKTHKMSAMATAEEKAKCPIHASLRLITSLIKKGQGDYATSMPVTAASWLDGSTKAEDAFKRKTMIATLQAIGNIGNCAQTCVDDIVPALFTILKYQHQVPRDIVYTALQAFRRMDLSLLIREKLLNFVNNKMVESEMRIIAYRQLMVTPTEWEIQEFVKKIGNSSDSDQQVKAYMFSHLKSIVESKDESNQGLTKTVVKALYKNPGNLRKPMSGGMAHVSQHYSRSHTMALPYLELPLEGKMSTDVIFDQNSILPRWTLMQLETQFLNQHTEVLDIAVRTTGMDAVFESLFGPAGVFKVLLPMLGDDFFKQFNRPLTESLQSIMSTVMATINSMSRNPFEPLRAFECLRWPERYMCKKYPAIQTLGRSMPQLHGLTLKLMHQIKRQNNWEHIDLTIQKGLKELRKMVERKPTKTGFSAYLRLFGNDIGSFNTDDLILMMDLVGKALRDLSWHLGRKANSLDLSFTKTSNYFHLDTNVPTGLGLPLNLSIDGYSVASVRAGFNMSYSRKHRWSATNEKIEDTAYFKPSFANDLNGRLEVTLPTFHTSGLHIKGSTSSSPAILVGSKIKEEAKSTEYHANSLWFSVYMPRKSMNLLRLSTGLSVLQGSGDGNVITGNQEYQMYTEHCGPQLLTDLTGQKICTRAEYQNATLARDQPWFPIAGKMDFGVGIEPNLDMEAIRFISRVTQHTTELDDEGYYNRDLLTQVVAAGPGGDTSLASIRYEWGKKPGLRATLKAAHVTWTSWLRNPWFIRYSPGNGPIDPWWAKTELQYGDQSQPDAQKVYMMEWNLTQTQINRRDRNPDTDPWGTHTLLWGVSVPGVTIKTSNQLKQEVTAQMDYTFGLEYQVKDKTSWLYQLHLDPEDAERHDGTTMVEIRANTSLVPIGSMQLLARLDTTLAYPGQSEMFWNNRLQFVKHVFPFNMQLNSTVGYIDQNGPQISLSSRLLSSSPFRHQLITNVESPKWLYTAINVGEYLPPAFKLTRTVYIQRKETTDTVRERSRTRRSAWFSRLERMHDTIIEDVSHLFGYDKPLNRPQEMDDGWNMVDRPWNVQYPHYRPFRYEITTTLSFVDETTDPRDRVYSIQYDSSHTGPTRPEVTMIKFTVGDNSIKKNVYYSYYANMTGSKSDIQSAIQARWGFLLDNDGMTVTHGLQLVVEGMPNTLFESALHYNKSEYSRIDFNHNLTSPVYNSMLKGQVAHGGVPMKENMFSVSVASSGSSRSLSLMDYDMQYNFTWLPSVFMGEYMKMVTPVVALNSDFEWDSDGFWQVIHLSPASGDRMSKPMPLMHCSYKWDNSKNTFKMDVGLPHLNPLHLVVTLEDPWLLTTTVTVGDPDNRSMYNPEKMYISKSSLAIVNRNTIKYDAWWNRPWLLKIREKLDEMKAVMQANKEKRFRNMIIHNGDTVDAYIEANPSPLMTQIDNSITFLEKQHIWGYIGNVLNDVATKKDAVSGKLRETLNKPLVQALKRTVENAVILPASNYVAFLQESWRDSYIGWAVGQLNLKERANMTMNYIYPMIRGIPSRKSYVVWPFKVASANYSEEKASVVLIHPFEWESFDRPLQLSPTQEFRLERIKRVLRTVERAASGQTSSGILGVSKSFIGLVFGDKFRHVITFDGSYTKLPDCNYDPGTHVLVHDVVDINVTVLMRRSEFIVITPTTSISIDKTVENPTIRINNASSAVTDFPYFKSLPGTIVYEIRALRDGPFIVIDTIYGLTVRYNFAEEIFIVELSGWYHGKTYGLLGTSNGDPSDDAPRPSDSAQMVNTFYVNTDVSGIRFCDAGRQGKIECSRDPRSECHGFFSEATSPMRACFDDVNPKPYLESCQLSSPCTSATSYASMCQVRGINVLIPTQCTSCADECKTESQQDTPQDVVLVMSVHYAMKSVFGEENLQQLVEKMKDEIVRNIRVHQTSRIGLVLFGPPGTAPVSLTANGKLLASLSEADIWYKTIRRGLEFSDVIPGDFISALKLASSYPFRKLSSRAVVLLTPTPGPTYRPPYATSINEVSDALRANDIVLNVVSSFPEMEGKPYVGINYNWTKLSPGGGKVSVFPNYAETKIARATKGAVFHSDQSSFPDLQDSMIRMMGEQVSRRRYSCKKCSCVANYGFHGVTQCKSVPCK